jgi:hypothetical protein
LLKVIPPSTQMGSQKTEAYVSALWDEIEAWQQLDAVLALQRKAIINRESAQVGNCQERVRGLLRDVMAACQQTMRRKAPLTDERGLETERRAQAMRLQVRDAVRLNNDLLRDVCSYLEALSKTLRPRQMSGNVMGPRVVGTLLHRAARPHSERRVA